MLPASAPSPTPSPSLARQEGVAPLLTTLHQQLQDAMEQMQSSVMDVVGRFSRIASESQAAVQGILHRGNSGLYSEDFELQSVLQGLLQKLESASQYSAEVGGRVASLIQPFDQVCSVLGEVQQVAGQCRMLAFNARIEAVRAGAAGAAFAVVAKETKDLAEQTAEMGIRIERLVVGLKKDITSVSTDMASSSERLHADVDLGRSQIDGAMRLLRRKQTDMELQLDDAARSGETVAKEIQQAIVSLQFEDAVRQRISHVSDALWQLANSDIGSVEIGLSRLAHELVRDVEQSLRSSYTMDQERAIDRNLESPLKGSAPGSVELF